MVPVRQFVANTQYNDNYQLSPDGSKLVYQGVSRLKPAILWTELGRKQDVHALRFRKGPPYPFWSADSRFLIYSNDPSGREQSHVFALDTESKDAAVRNLTPFEGVTAYVSHVPFAPSSKVFVSHNRRDRAVFDLYEIDLFTGEESLVFKNTNNVIDTLMDDEGNVLARVRQTDSHRFLEVRLDDGWDTLLTAGPFDWITPLEFSKDSNSLYVISNVDRDKAALLSIDLFSAEQSLIYEHPKVDVQYVYISRASGKPLAAFTEPDFPAINFFDSDLERQLGDFFTPGVNGISIMSMDRIESKATLVIYDHTGAIFLLVDLLNGTTEKTGRIGRSS